jgi:hypothetical protein
MHLQVDEPSAIAHALRKVGYRVGTPSLATRTSTSSRPKSTSRLVAWIRRSAARWWSCSAARLVNVVNE